MIDSSPSGASAGDGSPQPDTAAGAAAQKLSEQLLSDYNQIIQHIAAAQPSPGDRVIFAKHLIQTALDEQGFPPAAEQLEKEHHPLRHVMTEIHEYVKKHPPGYIFGLICMIVPSLVPSGLLSQATPPPTPPVGPRITYHLDAKATEKAVFLAHSQELVGRIADHLSGDFPDFPPQQQDVFGLAIYLDVAAHAPILGLTPEQLTQFNQFTPEQRDWLAAEISAELAHRSASNSEFTAQPVFPSPAEERAHPSPADPQ